MGQEDGHMNQYSSRENAPGGKYIMGECPVTVAAAILK